MRCAYRPDETMKLTLLTASRIDESNPARGTASRRKDSGGGLRKVSARVRRVVLSQCSEATVRAVPRCPLKRRNEPGASWRKQVEPRREIRWDSIIPMKIGGLDRSGRVKRGEFHERVRSLWFPRHPTWAPGIDEANPATAPQSQGPQNRKSRPKIILDWSWLEVSARPPSPWIVPKLGAAGGVSTGEQLVSRMSSIARTRPAQA